MKQKQKLNSSTGANVHTSRISFFWCNSKIKQMIFFNLWAGRTDCWLTLQCKRLWAELKPGRCDCEAVVSSDLQNGRSFEVLLGASGLRNVCGGPAGLWRSCDGKEPVTMVPLPMFVFLRCQRAYVWYEHVWLSVTAVLAVQARACQTCWTRVSQCEKHTVSESKPSQYQYCSTTTLHGKSRSCNQSLNHFWVKQAQRDSQQVTETEWTRHTCTPGGSYKTLWKYPRKTLDIFLVMYKNHMNKTLINEVEPC